jgi:hypothetical protein
LTRLLFRLACNWPIRQDVQRKQRAAKRLVLLALGLGLLGSAHVLGAQRSRTEAQIKESMIRASIATYSGSCPCPYNTDRAGRRCGKRSAYSRPGGRSPLCYPGDISGQMVEEYRKKNPR